MILRGRGGVVGWGWCKDWKDNLVWCCKLTLRLVQKIWGRLSNVVGRMSHLYWFFFMMEGNQSRQWVSLSKVISNLVVSCFSIVKQVHIIQEWIGGCFSLNVNN